MAPTKSVELTDFIIPLNESYSVMVWKRLSGTYLGIYKRDKRGKNRGVGLNLDLWHKLQSSKELIDLAIQLLEGTVGKQDEDE